MKKIIFILTLFFTLPATSLQASSADIIFNEIAWMGGSESSSDEWIELYNPNDENICLDDWQIITDDEQPKIVLSGIIPAYGYFLLERTDDDSATNVEADQIYTGSLSNDGETLSLINSDSEIINTINSSSGWLAGDNENKLTMSRNSNGNWVNSPFVGGSPKKLNPNNNENEEENTPSNKPAPENNSSNFNIKNSDLLITEFVSDPGDGKNEWIEIYNNTNNSLNLDNCYIEEGSETKSSFAQENICTSCYIILDKPRGNLNNTGDIIKLFCSDNLIDQVVYGEWKDYQDNAPLARDPESVYRKDLLTSTKNYSELFSTTDAPTPGVKNKSTNVNDVSGKVLPHIAISEILPNPEGPDEDDEFIELFNFEEKEISLQGLRLRDEGGNKFIFSAQIIPAKSYFVIYRSETKIALNNSGDKIELIDSTENILDSIYYTQAKSGESLALNIEQNEWQWTKNISPGEKNPKINHTPLPDFYFAENIKAGQPVFFDSSDTSDIDGDDLRYFWDFGDNFTNTLANPEHTFFFPNKYTVILEVGDGKATSSIKKTLEVTGATTLKTVTQVEEQKLANLKITEIFPNPEGDDKEGEFIEIFNPENFTVDLTGWSLDDAEGGSAPFIFENLLIKPNSYLAISRSDSGIVLNNSFDSARVINPAGDVINEQSYTKAKNDNAFILGKNGQWTWGDSISPGEENQISQQVKISTNPTINTPNTNNEFIKTDLENVRNLLIGDQVEVIGTIIVKPGVLATQYFYIQDSYGLQIYNYYKYFPPLKRGDRIIVRGELSEINNEFRIKTKEITDIFVISESAEPEAMQIDSEILNPENIGCLIKINGVITKKNNSTIYIETDEEEIPIYIKANTNISIKDFKIDDKLTITGILSENKNGPRLLPRDKNDIQKINKTKKDKEENIQVLGAEYKEWKLKREPQAPQIKYFLTIFMAGVLGWLIYKKTTRI